MKELNGLIQKENLTILGSIIKINRMNQNMSQQALSEGICVPSYLSKIENGEVVPSLEMIRLLFGELSIVYQDGVEFLQETRNQLELFFEELNLNGFIKSGEIFKQLEHNEEQLIHSPLIIDYYMAKLAFYCGRKEQDQYMSAKKTIQYVEGLLNRVQKHRFHFYEAINLYIIEKNLKRSKDELMLAQQSMETGHLYYFLANVEYKLGSYYGAVIYAEKALHYYLEEVNIINVSLTHQFQGLLIYQLGTKDLYERFFEKSISYAKKINRNDILLSTQILYTYILIKEKNANATEQLKQISSIVLTDEAQSEFKSYLFLLELLHANWKGHKSEKYMDVGSQSPFFQSLYHTYEELFATNTVSKEAYEELKDLYEKIGHQNLFCDCLLDDLWISYVENNRLYKQAYLKLKKDRM
ncbi:helix-turn-helix domain-containing protein [Gottfriedia solisilvae]|uniref:helix-turn-helix domain-containing protein n=1 Tax=Gottfriedia solisilvae TaxID=1516104 RepID=UPI003D2F317F